MAKGVFPVVAAVWLACATAQQPLPFTVIYEQSGGFGGIREYRLTIDSNGHARLERWSGWQDTSTIAWRLTPSERKQLTIAMEQALAVVERDSVGSPELYPDAPVRVITINNQHISRRIALGIAAPDPLRSFAGYLDSIAAVAGSPR